MYSVWLSHVVIVGWSLSDIVTECAKLLKLSDMTTKFLNVI